MQNLKEKAIDIKGKDYVLVKDRVIYFNENYPNGNIITELLSSFDSPQVIIKATVTPDIENKDRYFTGYSQAVVGDGYINKTSALENAETSAVGRALGLMGIGVLESIASADEVRKAENAQNASKSAGSPKVVPTYQNSQNVAPRGVQPQIQPSGERAVGGMCQDCGKGVYRLSQANKLYCSSKCWLGKNEAKQSPGYDDPHYPPEPREPRPEDLY